MKKDLLERVINEITKEKEEIERSIASINKDINDAPSPGQSHSDTTRFQLTEVVNSLSESVTQKERAISNLIAYSGKIPENMNKILLGAFVEVTDSENTSEFYAILPDGAGMNIDIGGKNYIVITLNSPLTRSLLKKVTGETVLVQVGQNQRTLKVISIK